jgi:hypothetical protein
MVLVERRRHLKAKSRRVDNVDRHESPGSGENPLITEEHVPVSVSALGPIQFSRCQCGFTLAKYDGKLFWIQAKPGIRQILGTAELARALRTRCWHYRRKNKPTHKTPVSVAPSNSDTIGSR